MIEFNSGVNDVIYYIIVLALNISEMQHAGDLICFAQKLSLTIMLFQRKLCCDDIPFRSFNPAFNCGVFLKTL